MKKNLFSANKMQLLLAVAFIGNLNAFAANATINADFSSYSQFPKPQYQNKLGTFWLDLSEAEVSVNNVSKRFNEYFGLDQHHTFELIKEQFNSETGFTNSSYQHFYKNVKVHGDVVFIHAKQEKVNYLSGQIVNIKDVSVSATLSIDKVKAVAYDDFGRKENVKESAVETFIIKQESGENGVMPTLVNKINLTAVYPLKSIDYIIDATSGALISQTNKIYKVDTPSTSTTYFRGNKSMTVDSYSGSYRLMDNARQIRTLNGSQLTGSLNANGTFSGFTEYTNATPNFTSTSSRPAVEVHWAMRQTYDYYKNIHNRTSFDGNGHSINNYYDAGAALGTDENAGALDEVIDNDIYNGMFYGRGGADLHPVVSLDVAGHEFSHMVINRNGNGGLDYKGESGALNESFADIFGTAVEFYVNDNPNWTIGEGIIKNNVNPNYLRNMSDPNNTPAFLAPNQPDTYKGNHWFSTNSSFDNGGVHINSGVGNYWFYLLSVGGMGTNDLGNKYYVNGITIQKAEKIAYNALTGGLSPTATYLDAYNATITAALTMYGANSNEWEQVVNAWYAVGMGDAPASTKNYEMQSKLKVFPNPTTGNKVTIDSDLDTATTVEMFDLTGKKVLAPMLLENRTVINVSAYKTGMYILKFKSHTGEYSHKLMIK